MVSHELRKTHHEVLVHTGQHYDCQMSQVFFDELDIPEPNYNLGIGSDSHARQTARAMMALEEVLLKENPDMLLVYGDTNSTLAAALTASKMGIRIAHVEAGPRMFDMTVPEEVNRVVTDHLSTLLFAPTQTSAENLAKEGITGGVHLTGDVMYDAFLKYAPIASGKSRILERLGLHQKGYAYVTVHRARNTDDPIRLRAIVRALIDLDTRLVLPVHPRTRKSLEAAGLCRELASASHVTLSEPVGYLDSLMLTMEARTIVTDSGGLQREAYFAQVPCLTLDDATPWPETIACGWNTLVPCMSNTLTEVVQVPRCCDGYPPLFGNGGAAQSIARLIGSLA